MKQRVCLTVEATPIPQPRHRIRMAGRFPTAYIAKSHKIHGYKARIIEEWQRSGASRFDGAVCVNVTFGFGGKRDVSPRPKRPDIDNLLKAVLDALTGAGAWKDDAQVSRCVCAKLNTSSHDFVVIEITGDGYKCQAKSRD